MDFRAKESRLLIIFGTFLLLTLLGYNLSIASEQQYSLLAKSFLSGALHFTDLPQNLGDTVLVNEKYYWPNPPFPAVVLLPFVFFSSFLGFLFLQGYLQPFMAIGVFWAVLTIARKLGYSVRDGVYWAAGFVFGSSFLGVAMIPWSWYFAHVLTVLLLFLAYLEYLNKKRYSLIGVYFSLVFLTRFSATLGVLFFVFELLRTKESRFEKFRNLARLLTPLVFGILASLLYNKLRFGVTGDLGYLHNFLAEAHERAREYGVFSIAHVPGNIYYMFLNSPDIVLRDGVSKVLSFPYIKADHWGMGLFLLSPYYLYLFVARKYNRQNVNLLITAFSIMIPIFFYFGIGWVQYGSRYSLDFLPWLHIALMAIYKENSGKLSTRFTALLVLGVIINIYLLSTFWL